MRNGLLSMHDTLTVYATIGLRVRAPPSMNLRLLIFVLVLFPLLARAATTNVTVGQGGTNFNPRTVTIQGGDTVKWTWAGNNHSATSGNPNTPNGIFDSGIHNNGFTFSFTFPTA